MISHLTTIAGAITGVAAAGAVVWSLNPFALADDVDSEIKRLEKLFVQSTLEAARHQQDYYQQQQDALVLRRLDVESRPDLPEDVRQEYLQSLGNEARRVGTTLERAQSRVRALAPAISVPAQ